MKEKKQHIIMLVVVDVSAFLAPIMYLLTVYFFDSEKLREMHVIVIICVWFALAIVGSVIWTVYIIKKIKKIP